MSNYGFTVPTGGYDNQNRLTAWNRTDGVRNQTWALSAVGDWNTFTDAGVAQTRTHGPAHEILTMAAATVTHDSRGNMTVDEQAKAFTWDTSNMLKQAVVPSGSSTGTAGTHLYKYDALGRRIAKTTDSTGTPFTTVYIHVGPQVYAEYQASQLYSNPLRKYTYGPYVDEPVLLVDRTAAGSVGAGTEELFYYHRNQQYSITALTDNTGVVMERYAYTAYGEPKILDGVGTTTRTASFIGNPYLYTARAYDAESGLYYFRARMYEGRKGRFLSHDPIMYPDGANTYAGWFVPFTTDPLGRDYQVSINSEWEHLDNLKCNDVAMIMWKFRLRLPKRKGQKIGSEVQWRGESGYLIQKVDVACNIAKCGESSVASADSYYEVFKVSWDENGNQKIENDQSSEVKDTATGKKDHITVTDTARANSTDGQFGKYRADGEVRFFFHSMARETEIGTWMQDVKILGGSLCATSSGSLLGSLSAPSFWDEAGTPTGKVTPGKRWFEMEYDCCPCAAKFMKADAFPRNK